LLEKKISLIFSAKEYAGYKIKISMFKIKNIHGTWSDYSFYIDFFNNTLHKNKFGFLRLKR
jgi:hypothetical protein